MPVMKHALTGGIYELQDDGLIKVTEDDVEGLFHADGRYESGELTHADLHLLGWLGGTQTDPGANRHAAAHIKNQDQEK